MTLTLNDDGSITKDGIRYVPEPAKAERADLAEELVYHGIGEQRIMLCTGKGRHQATFTSEVEADAALPELQKMLRHAIREAVRRAEESSGGLLYTVKGFKAAILSQIKDTTP